MKKRYWILLLVLCGLDVMTKYIVITNIKFREIINVIDGFFYFTYVRNTGAAWSLLDGHPWIFLILASAASLALMFYLVKKAKQMKALEVASFVFILAGTVGNLIDRIRFGYVIDFLGVYLGSYSFPIFNLADSFLVLGVLGYLAHLYLEEKKGKTS